MQPLRCRDYSLFAAPRRWRNTIRPGRSLVALYAHRTRTPKSAPTELPPIPDDPADFALETLQFPLDATQQQILRDPAPRIAINCSRQWGKSTVAAIGILHFALKNPGKLTLIASLTELQAATLLDKVITFAASIGIPRRRVPNHSTSLELPNGARILAVPGSSDGRRGLSAVSLLVIDEAAYASDDLYTTLRPMLATTSGSIWLLSTPNGRKGFFYDICTRPDSVGEPWSIYTVPATQCPRIAPAFLDSELHTLGPARYAQEYLCAFNAASMSVFDTSVFDREHPWPPYATAERAGAYYIGLDIGKHDSHSALVVLHHWATWSKDLNPVTGEYDPLDKLAVIDTHIFPLQTPFREVIRKVGAIIRNLNRRNGEPAWLIYDATGSGQMFRDLLSPSAVDASITGIMITASGTPNYANNYQYVSKADLFETMAFALTHDKFAIAPRSGAHDLRKALDAIQVRSSESSEPRYHHTAPDDLAMALSLALWKARTLLL